MIRDVTTALRGSAAALGLAAPAGFGAGTPGFGAGTPGFAPIGGFPGTGWPTAGLLAGGTPGGVGFFGGLGSFGFAMIMLLF